jgi:hypothetical protein
VKVGISDANSDSGRRREFVSIEQISTAGYESRRNRSEIELRMLISPIDRESMPTKDVESIVIFEKCISGEC